jgi:hypothetical protein
MEFLTKEESKQKRKSVNNQNNSIELFPVINTELYHHKNDKNQLRKDQEWS